MFLVTADDMASHDSNRLGNGVEVMLWVVEFTAIQRRDIGIGRDMVCDRIGRDQLIIEAADCASSNGIRLVVFEYLTSPGRPAVLLPDPEDKGPWLMFQGFPVADRLVAPDRTHHTLNAFGHVIPIDLSDEEQAQTIVNNPGVLIWDLFHTGRNRFYSRFLLSPGSMVQKAMIDQLKERLGGRMPHSIGEPTSDFEPKRLPHPKIRKRRERVLQLFLDGYGQSEISEILDRENFSAYSEETVKGDLAALRRQGKLTIKRQGNSPN